MRLRSMCRSGAGPSRRGGGHRRGAPCPVPEKTLPEKCWKERLVTAFPDGERRIHDCRPFAPWEKGITSPGALTCEFSGAVMGNCFLVYLGGNFHRHMPALRAARIPLESRSRRTDSALVSRRALLPAGRVLCLRGWSAPVAPEGGGVRGGLRQERVREGLTHAPVTPGFVPESAGPSPARVVLGQVDDSVRAVSCTGPVNSGPAVGGVPASGLCGRGPVGRCRPRPVRPS